jgi:hypothetical protein
MRFIKQSTHPGIIASPVSGKPKTASSPEPSKMRNDQGMQAVRYLSGRIIINYEVYKSRTTTYPKIA